MSSGCTMRKMGRPMISPGDRPNKGPTSLLTRSMTRFPSVVPIAASISAERAPHPGRPRSGHDDRQHEPRRRVPTYGPDPYPGADRGAVAQAKLPVGLIAVQLPGDQQLEGVGRPVLGEGLENTPDDLLAGGQQLSGELVGSHDPSRRHLQDESGHGTATDHVLHALGRVARGGTRESRLRNHRAPRSSEP